ncbi:DUF6660 family protein [Chitinophaga japonensis]|uniref:Uncharacterized protein n=1 Tax=Chitinophaga japonensis TaxID=104662 RepID=A0A562ST26_CHIJA|nr:DUF6660 family protein [Chitinophaga japonensis]TWI84427.1 hypothetical protein LX66_4797 [Chitinophaga japonensis]
MKWLLYLFSFYVLLLSGIPCDADEHCCADEITCTTEPAKPAHDPDHKPACPCSPFFACGACHAIVVPDHTIEFLKPLRPVAAPQSDYKVHPPADFSPSIWQPPRRARTTA